MIDCTLSHKRNSSRQKKLGNRIKGKMEVNEESNFKSFDGGEGHNEVSRDCFRQVARSLKKEVHNTRQEEEVMKAVNLSKRCHNAHLRFSKFPSRAINDSSVASWLDYRALGSNNAHNTASIYRASASFNYPILFPRPA